MQTFLPLPSFWASLRCLDDRRLGNQVYREGRTLLMGGWPNHPASKMWRGHTHALAAYCIVGCEVLAERGRVYGGHSSTFQEALRDNPDTGLPPWFGAAEFHASHRSNLLRKDPAHYSQFGWSEPDDLPYVWPTNMQVKYFEHAGAKPQVLEAYQSTPLVMRVAMPDGRHIYTPWGWRASGPFCTPVDDPVAQAAEEGFKS